MAKTALQLQILCNSKGVRIIVLEFTFCGCTCVSCVHLWAPLPREWPFWIVNTVTLTSWCSLYYVQLAASVSLPLL